MDFTLTLYDPYVAITLTDTSFTWAMIHAESLAESGIVTVWPKATYDGTDQMICTVHKGLTLTITHALDNARYIGPFWGHKYPHGRSDWNAYDKLDPANYRNDRGQFFRDCRSRFGKCTGKLADGTGWIFGRTDRSYDPIYVETIVRVIGIGHPDWAGIDARMKSARAA